VALGSSGAYDFSALGFPNMGQVTTPSGEVLTPSNRQGFYYTTDQSFSTQAAMDAAFPAGTYTFAVPNLIAVSIAFGSDTYPPPPVIVNGYWKNGDLLVDPNHDATIGLYSFPGYATHGINGGGIDITVTQTGDSDPVYTNQWYSVLTPAPPDVFIPAGALKEGQVYSLEIDYAEFGSENITTNPGTEYFTSYESATNLTIVATAPPSQMPAVTVQPQSHTIAALRSVVLKCAATGVPAPDYQWYFNGSPIANSQQPTYILNYAAPANAGSYYCVASNPSGSATSSTVTLAVSATNDIGRLTNISCRAAVGTGAGVMIAGFTVGGNPSFANQDLLVRASGPALGQFNVPGILPDPQLALFNTSVQIGSNAGWMGDGNIAAAAARVSAFSWPSPNSHDSAILKSLDWGGYTAQVSGESGDTGVALVEVYDETPAGTYMPSMPRLTNISTRVQVGTGGNILIAGFAIQGSTDMTVLIRASGPALTQLSVPGVLPDPQLQLFSGNTVIASNSGWEGDPALTAAANDVGAFRWEDSTSADSAILLTLAPGLYTAQVAGASGDTGVALIEVYEVP
jgi:hypothetical protein